MTIKSLIFGSTCLILLALQACTEKTPFANSDEEHFEKFGWTIKIPEGYEKVSAKEWEKIQNKGAEAIEASIGEEVVDRPTTLFIVKKGDSNFIESNYQAYESESGVSYKQSCDAVNQMLYETFSTQIPETEIDSSSYISLIDGLEFNTFQIGIDFPNGVTLKSILYSRLFKDEEFTTSILYVDSLEGEKMINAWENSTFEK